MCCMRKPRSGQVVCHVVNIRGSQYLNPQTKGSFCHSPPQSLTGNCQLRQCVLEPQIVARFCAGVSKPRMRNYSHLSWLYGWDKSLAPVRFCVCVWVSRTCFQVTCPVCPLLFCNLPLIFHSAYYLPVSALCVPQIPLPKQFLEQPPPFSSFFTSTQSSSP